MRTFEGRFHWLHDPAVELLPDSPSRPQELLVTQPPMMARAYFHGWFIVDS